MNLLRAEGLSKEFGGLRAVDSVSFEVSHGKVTSIIGPNGAGKTTLLNLLTGIYAPSGGRILLDDVDLAGRAPHQFAEAGVARTFQNLQVFFNMTALENVMVGRYRRERCSLATALLRTSALARAERACREEAAELMRFVGLAEWLDARSEAMPYGALKRLEIARALATEPRLLLLDEPAAGLNPAEMRGIAELIGRLCAHGRTVMLVEHNMRLVMGISDHVLVLDYGRKLAEGPADAVRHDPRVIEAYLGAAARVH
ncbi:MAG TPA: ABC transporter ATP-binding protein [Burkholderiales bacterium]|nr:ABC transporter ATP-binding protein [Burkholderiales bacterium]